MTKRWVATLKDVSGSVKPPLVTHVWGADGLLGVKFVVEFDRKYQCSSGPCGAVLLDGAGIFTAGWVRTKTIRQP